MAVCSPEETLTFLLCNLANIFIGVWGIVGGVTKVIQQQQCMGLLFLFCSIWVSIDFTGVVSTGCRLAYQQSDVSSPRRPLVAGP